MKRTAFIQELEKIWRENNLILKKTTIFRKYLLDKKKEVVVTPIESEADRRGLFFKALKPEASAKTFADFQRGITVLKILQKAKVGTVPRIIKVSPQLSFSKQGRVGEREVFWSLTQLLPMEETLSDEKVRTLTAVNAQKIVRAIFNLQDKFQVYALKYKNYLACLPPLSRFLETVSFKGQILFFEKHLKEKGFLSQEKTSQTKRESLSSQPQGSSFPFLIHGDLAPHNILLGEKLYFIDWERSFVTFNQEIGPFYDLANLYVYTWQNQKFQESLRKAIAESLKRFSENFTTFDLCVYYHLLYKASYILWYGLERENEKFLSWVRKELAS